MPRQAVFRCLQAGSTVCAIGHLNEHAAGLLMGTIHLAALDYTRPVLVVTRDVTIGRMRTVTVA